MNFKKTIIGLFAFYFLAASTMYVGTIVHEYSHYVGHEGFGVAPIQFLDNPDAARAELVTVDSVQSNGQTYRVENVEKTTIVIYDDALLYALTLNLLPVSAYETGSLGATFLHADDSQAQSLVSGETHEGWGATMGAPLFVAVAMVGGLAAIVFWKSNLVARSLLVAYAAEMGNNAHHAADIGMSAGLYGIVAELVFAGALVAAVAMSPTYKSLLGNPSKAPKTPSVPATPATPVAPLRFNHAPRYNAKTGAPTFQA